MSAIITAQSASDGSVSHCILTSPTTTNESRPLIGPSTWKSIWKMNPETAGTTIIGSRKYTITSPRPRKSLIGSTARMKPSTPSTTVQTTASSTFRQTAVQNSVDFNASQ